MLSKWIWVALLLLTAGCSNLNPTPFVQYNSAIQEAQSGIDAALSVTHDWAREGFAEGFAVDPESEFHQLVLETGAGYQWTWEASPLYVQLFNLRPALFALNSVMADYAELLLDLATHDLSDSSRFAELSGDINQHAYEAGVALGLEGDRASLALFSTLAGGLIQQYVQSKRGIHLRNAIRENQPRITAYADRCIYLIQRLMVTTKRYYADRHEPIRLQWTGTTKLTSRVKPTEQMLDLNEAYIATMRTLEELERTFAALPLAHRELAENLDAPQPILEEMRALHDSAVRLRRLYHELSGGGDE